MRLRFVGRPSAPSMYPGLFMLDDEEIVEGGLPGCVLVGDCPLPELPLSLLPGGVRFCGLRLSSQS
jgi:hypothetical protein